MHDFDYLPEDGYDPTSGEYSNEFDFEPVFSQRIFLTDDQKTYADVTSELNFEPDGERIANLLDELAGQGIFEPDYDANNPRNYPQLPADFDFADKHIRGPFIGQRAVDDWLKKSGLKGVAIPYYNYEWDEFWIDVNTN